MFLIFIKGVLYFSVAGTNFMTSDTEAFHFRWGVLASWYIWYSWYHLILHQFFKVHSIFWQTINIFQVEGWFWLFWLILVCSTMGGSIECFFRMFYQIYPRATILIITHVTIRLWEVCTISNALPLLVHCQMCYHVPYRTFKYITVSFSVLYHALSWSFLKRSILKSF